MSAPQRFSPRPLFWVLIVLIVAVGAVVLDDGSLFRVFHLSHDDLLQATYLIAILLFVGSALLGRRLGASEIIRATVSWLALLLVLVAAYAYRDELTIVGGRMLSALVPGVPISGRVVGGSAGSVVISRSLDGHFAVRAGINDVPMTLLVDTGASFVTLTTADARHVGIDPSTLRYTMPIRTANGEIHAAPVKIDHLTVGDIDRTNLPALVAPKGSLDQSLLGMSFLDTLGSYAITGNHLVMTP